MPRIVRGLRKNVGELTRAMEEAERKSAKRCKSFKREASSFSAPGSTEGL